MIYNFGDKFFLFLLFDKFVDKFFLSMSILQLLNVWLSRRNLKILWIAFILAKAHGDEVWEALCCCCCFGMKVVGNSFLIFSHFPQLHFVKLSADRKFTLYLGSVVLLFFRTHTNVSQNTFIGLFWPMGS